MPNLFRERQRAAAPVSPKQSVTWAVTWKSRFQVRGFGGMGIGIGFWVRKHQYLSLSHASSRLCAWSRSHNNHKTTLCSLTRSLNMIGIALDSYVCVRACSMSLKAAPLVVARGRSRIADFRAAMSNHCVFFFSLLSPCALTWHVSFALYFPGG